MAVHKLKISGALLDNLLATSQHPAWQDAVDSADTSVSPQILSSGLEQDFNVDGLVRNETSFPSHITQLYNPATGVAKFSEEIDSPLYVIRVSCTIDPASQGELTFKLNVNDAVPKALQTSTVNFKNAMTVKSAIFTFYLGSEVGYDVKNDGVFISVVSDVNADIYDKSILIYRT